ncbi:Cuticle structural protein PCP16.7, post-ecdysial [Gryllus bimaculatus]|nr:Cuticle structural protein PCP16.7, post-ecdysial [Gryllus bimaculatus]
MKIAIALVLCLAAVASAGIAPVTTLVRTPSLDSAVIQSDRLGGNFAYSSVEGHAYAAITPVVQNVVQPVGVSYTAHQVPVGGATRLPPNSSPRPHPLRSSPAPPPQFRRPRRRPCRRPAFLPSLISGYPVAVASPAGPAAPATAAPAADAPASAPAPVQPAPAPLPAADLASGDSVSVESA